MNTVMAFADLEAFFAHIIVNMWLALILVAVTILYIALILISPRFLLGEKYPKGIVLAGFLTKLGFVTTGLASAIMSWEMLHKINVPFSIQFTLHSIMLISLVGTVIFSIIKILYDIHLSRTVQKYLCMIDKGLLKEKEANRIMLQGDIHNTSLD